MFFDSTGAGARCLDQPKPWYSGDGVEGGTELAKSDPEIGIVVVKNSGRQSFEKLRDGSTASELPDRIGNPPIASRNIHEAEFVMITQSVPGAKWMAIQFDAA